MTPPNPITPQGPISAERLVLSIRTLPSVPGIVADALRILDDPGSSAEEISAVVSRDQTLTAKSLRVVNSAAFGLARQVTTIREAVVMIGVRRIRGMVGAMATSGFFAKEIPGLVDPKYLWAHSLATSTWATEIIEIRKLWDAQSAVIGALLHDIGIVILCQFATERYRLTLEKTRLEKFPLHEVEQRELGTTHAFVGATLCAKWQMPPPVALLVQHHHSDKLMEEKAFGVVVLANHLAHLYGAKPFDWVATPPLPAGLLESLGVDDEAMARLLTRKTSVEEKTNALLEAARD